MENKKFPDFKTIKQLHDWGCDQDYDWYCKYGFITKDEYKELTGKDYTGEIEDN